MELYNAGLAPMDLTGYDLRLGTAGYYTLPPFVLAPDSSVVIHVNTGGNDTSAHLYTGPMAGGMSNVAASIVLFDGTDHSAETMVDFVQYGAGGQAWESAAATAGLWTEGDFVPAVVEGDSINLRPDGNDSNTGTDWQACNPTAPGSNCTAQIRLFLPLIFRN